MFRDCWKRKRVKGWKNEVRSLARGLSDARDYDVQIEFLTRSLAAISDDRLVPGIARLLSHAEQQRQWSQPQALRAVDRLAHSGALKQMQAAARRLLHAASETEDVIAATSPASRRRAAKEVGKRLKKLLGEAGGLADAEGYARHHAMRIAAKRLRYALELVRPRQSPEMDAVIESVKKLQTLLGEVHDCDVWSDTLAAFSRTEAAQIYGFFGDSQRFDRLRPGLDYLIQDRKARRDQAFAELVSFWQELCDKRVWEQLMVLLRSGAAARLSNNGAAAIAAVGAAAK
jgi:CHAD domain-containing protein